MTTSIMKMRDYNKGDGHGGMKNYGDGVCSGIVVGDSCTQSANYRFF